MLINERERLADGEVDLPQMSSKHNDDAITT